MTAPATLSEYVGGTRLAGLLARQNEENVDPAEVV